MIEIKRVIFTLIWVLTLCPISVSAIDYDKFIPLIEAGANIRQYSRNETDLDNLVFNVLNNHHNFENISHLTPVTDTAGVLKICDAPFIDDVMYKTFRINTPRPTPDMLIDLGYYYNNGYYYYKSLSAPQSSVEVNEITKVLPLDDGGIYVIFTDTYTSDEALPVTENSAMKLYHDNHGWYISQIYMGLDFSNLSEHLKTPSPAAPYIEFVWDILPAAIFIITIVIAVIILYKFVLF